MSEIMEDVEYLSHEIGPRPAGTEEEQQAALYIADQMQKRTGFAANIEDFSCAVHPGIVDAILFGVAALVSLLAILSRVFVIPAFLLTLVCAILFAFEMMDRPFVSRLFNRGVSQNVVARYVPGAKAAARGRKVVLVANYDSGKVSAELKGGLFSIYPIFAKASCIGLVALPVIWLIRSLFLLHSTGGAVAFFNLLAAIALILALVPVLRFLAHRFATYNEAANNNAAGVATMLEVARLIAEGSLSEEEIEAAENAQIHDEDTVRAAGVLPESVELEYDSGIEQSPSERLASAKAAVAALTGKPLRSYENEDVVSLISVTEEDSQASAFDEQGSSESAPAAASSEFTPHPVTHRSAEGAPEEGDEQDYASADSGSDFDQGEAANANESEEFAQSALPAASANEPAWFTTGRAKAAKPAGADEAPIRRSRYADILEVALAASESHMEKAAQMLDEGSLERIGQMQRDIEAAGTETAATEREIDPYEDAAGDQAILAEEQLAEEGVVQAEAAAEGTVQPEEAPHARAAFAFEEAVAEEPVPESEEEAFAPPSAESDNVGAAQEAADSMQFTGEIDIDWGEDAVDEGEEAAESKEAELAARQAAAPVADQEPTMVLPAIPPIEEDVRPQTAPAPLESVMLTYEEVELLDGATTAMPPIDVESLRGAGKPAAAPAAHDFSAIGVARHRDRTEAPVLAEEQKPAPADEEAPSTQAREDERAADAAAEAAAEAAAAEAAAREAENEARRATAEKRAALAHAIPTLSGDFTRSEAPTDEENTEVSKTGSFAAVGSATAIDPVGDELVASLPAEERYVDDADDSSFDDNVTETGAFAGPDYMDMPESRLSRFFNRFRRKPAEEESSAAEWLDVDEDFNPTEVGAARGGWESFRTEADAGTDDAGLHEEADGESGTQDSGSGRSWNGGAFSKLRERLSEIVDGSSEEADDYADLYPEDEQDEEALDATAEDADEEADEWHEADYADEAADDAETEPAANWAEGDGREDRAFAPAAEADATADADESAHADAAPIAAPKPEAEAAVARPSKAKAARRDSSAAEEALIAEETAAIYNFRNPDVNTEVWFVALGSEYAGNGGMKSFLDEHADELRGAVIVNLEAMGAGELSFVQEEGYVLPRRASSRMKRFLRRATEATGIGVGNARIDWRDSAASVAMGRGLQAMTLAGMEGGKPALLGQGDDVLENVDEAAIADHARFVLELVKNI